MARVTRLPVRNHAGDITALRLRVRSMIRATASQAVTRSVHSLHVVHERTRTYRIGSRQIKRRRVNVFVDVFVTPFQVRIVN